MESLTNVLKEQISMTHFYSLRPKLYVTLERKKIVPNYMSFYNTIKH